MGLGGSKEKGQNRLFQPFLFARILVQPNFEKEKIITANTPEIKIMTWN